jgi:5-methylcytosine-specific restriction endonuclease McrA
MMKQRSITITDEQIREQFNLGKTLHEAAVELNSTTVTLWRKAKKLGISWKDIKRENKDKITLTEILDGKHPSYQTFKLKNRLIKEGIKENKCEECGITEWMGQELVMHLDHKDGNSHNHVIDNLRLLCPNCHAQTDTWCGKNK